MERLLESSFWFFNMRFHSLIVLVGSVSVSSPSSGATNEYMSALNYQKYTCQQLAAEAQATASRALRLARMTSDKHMSKGVREAETVVIRWPDLSSDALDNTPTANIKTQMLIIEEARIEKQCNIQFEAHTR
jgi:hypothetical protein